MEPLMSCGVGNMWRDQPASTTPSVGAHSPASDGSNVYGDGARGTPLQGNPKQRIQAFAKRYGDTHLRLAYHAAFPMSLTPDLLYRLWGNIQHEQRGAYAEDPAPIPWLAVSDLLIASGLCESVGHDLYEINPDVRQELLQALEADPRYGKPRIDELAEFTLDYAETRLHSSDPLERDFAQVQRWGALAYRQPNQAAKELAQALSYAYREDLPDLNRMATVVLNLSDPLKDYPSLLDYARGMARFARGDNAGALEYLKRFFAVGTALTIEGITLPLPTLDTGSQGRTQPPPESNRRFIRLVLGALISAVLLGGGFLLSRYISFQSNQLEPPEPLPEVAANDPLAPELEPESEGTNEADEPDTVAPVTEFENEPNTWADLPEDVIIPPDVILPPEPTPEPEPEPPDESPLDSIAPIAPLDADSDATGDIDDGNPERDSLNPSEPVFGTPDGDAEGEVTPIDPDVDSENGENETSVAVDGSGEDEPGIPEGSDNPDTSPSTDSSSEPTANGVTINVEPLRELLQAGNWREADAETYRLLVAAGDEDKNGWLSTSEVEALSCDDLRAIDQVWLEASDGKFGISVQVRIWWEVARTTKYEGLWERWVEFADRVGWRINNAWIAVDEVTFDTTPPAGHLPIGRGLAGGSCHNCGVGAEFIDSAALCEF